MIAPTLACANYLRLESDIAEMDRAGVDFYHLDMMDGHYVPNLCLNFDFICAVKSITDTPLEVHLMVDNPMDYVKRLAESGVACVSAHINLLKDNAKYFIEKVHKNHMKAGLVLSPEDSVQSIRPYLAGLEYVLVMCVTPGFSGQPFMEEMLVKIEALKKLREKENLSFFIEVDGGVGWDNIDRLKKAGADVAVAGMFAIFGQDTGLYEATLQFRSVSNQ